MRKGHPGHFDQGGPLFDPLYLGPAFWYSLRTRLMTVGLASQRKQSNVPFGAPAEVQSILHWGRSSH